MFPFSHCNAQTNMNLDKKMGHLQSKPESAPLGYKQITGSTKQHYDLFSSNIVIIQNLK